MENTAENNEFDKTVNGILADSTKCELLAETLDNQIQSDEEPFDRKGAAIINAYRNKNVDLLLIAICGWGFKTLVEMSQLEAQRQLRAEYTEGIVSIIKSCGTFTIADVEAETTPVLITTKDSLLMAETFCEDNVIPVLRNNNGEMLESSPLPIPYEDIGVHTLSEIHALALKWEELKQEEE